LILIFVIPIFVTVVSVPINDGHRM